MEGRFGKFIKYVISTISFDNLSYVTLLLIARSSHAIGAVLLRIMDLNDSIIGPILDPGAYPLRRSTMSEVRVVIDDQFLKSLKIGYVFTRIGLKVYPTECRR